MLLIVVVLLSLPLGWFAWRMRRAERQRRAVEVIRQAEGWVRYDYEAVSSEPRGPAWLREQIGIDVFSYVVECHSSAFPAEFGNRELESVRELTELETLTLCNTQITDVGLEHLQGLTTLRRLSFRCTQVSLLAGRVTQLASRRF